MGELASGLKGSLALGTREKLVPVLKEILVLGARGSQERRHLGSRELGRKGGL